MSASFPVELQLLQPPHVRAPGETWHSQNPTKLRSRSAGETRGLVLFGRAVPANLHAWVSPRQRRMAPGRNRQWARHPGVTAGRGRGQGARGAGSNVGLGVWGLTGQRRPVEQPGDGGGRCLVETRRGGGKTRFSEL